MLIHSLLSRVGLLLFLLLGLSAPLLAQSGTIAGRVVDAETGESLPGANVLILGTAVGTATDAAGHFVLRTVAVNTHSVRVSLLGYQTVTRTIEVLEGQRVVLDVALSEQAVDLGGITVVSRRGGFVPATLAAGSKIGAAPLETPQSVSIITQDQLEVQDANTLAEALRYTPGVQGEAWGFEPRFTWLKIRGFDATQTGLYRDGLQLRNVNYAVGYNVETYGMERVEVLRGPASVLYGAGSPGGLVSFSSKRPTQVAQREVGVEGGSFGRLQAQADLSGPFDAEGRFAYRLTGLYRSSETQVDFVDNDRVYVAPAFTWRPTAATQWTLLGHYQRDETGASQALPIEGTLEQSSAGEIPVNRYTGEPGVDGYLRAEHSVSSLFEHQIGRTWVLRQNTRYYNSTLDDVTVFTTGLESGGRTISRAVFGSYGALSGVSLDNQIRATFNRDGLATTLLGGLDYGFVDVSLRQTYGGAPSLDIFDPEYGQPFDAPPVYADSEARQGQLGLYLQGQFKLLDRWVLSLNGRYDWARTENRDLLQQTRFEQDDRAFTGRAGVVYLSPIGLAPYASYAESFLPAIGLDPDGQPFVPERGRQVEAGVKYQPSGWNSFLTLAFFSLTQENFLQYDPNSFAQVQTGEVRSRGVELEGVASLVNGLDVTAGLTVLDVEILRSSNPVEVGERPTQIPGHTASLWADYSLQRGPLSGLGFGAGVRYLGTTYGDIPNTIEAPAATLADAALYYDWSGFRLGVNVQNVFDDAYVASAFARSSTLVTFGAARQVTASLRYRF